MNFFAILFLSAFAANFLIGLIFEFLPKRYAEKTEKIFRILIAVCIGIAIISSLFAIF